MKTYKFNGAKNPSADNTAVLSMTKTRTANVGEEIDLTDDEYERLSATLKLTEVGGSKSSSTHDSDSDGTVTSDSSSK